jgi:hypothetical protein
MIEVEDTRNHRAEMHHKFVASEISFLINMPESFPTLSVNASLTIIDSKLKMKFSDESSEKILGSL